MKATFAFLFLFLVGVQVFADTPAVVLEDLKTWRQVTAERTDLEEREKDLRLDFIHRLIFQVDRKYQGEDLKAFCQSTFKELLFYAENIGPTEFFVQNLLQTLNEVLEPRESVVALIKEYTEFSGISDPANSDDFANQRSYFDGKNTLQAKEVDLEAAGNIPDQDFIKMDFTLVNSLNPIEPSSLPNPDSLIPPKGILGSENTP